MRSTEDKFQTVIQKNTFYFFDNQFEERYESHIASLQGTLNIVQNRIKTEGIRKEIFEWLLKEKENGLEALLTLTGFSSEYLKRLTTVLRIVDDPELTKLIHKNRWCANTDSSNIGEWSTEKIARLVRENEFFRKGIVNLFFEGASIPFLANTVPLFELKKLDISKLSFEIAPLLDTLIRYKEKGSRASKQENNSENIVNNIVQQLGLTSEKGDLHALIHNAPAEKRTMDFIIPNKKCPLIIAESSFLVTTSSQQGDKSKAVITVGKLLKKHYPNAKFVGFIDGIGWYVRKQDLQRMVGAYDDVFTFHKDELLRFETLLKETFPK